MASLLLATALCDLLLSDAEALMPWILSSGCFVALVLTCLQELLCHAFYRLAENRDLLVNDMLSA